MNPLSARPQYRCLISVRNADGAVQLGQEILESAYSCDELFVDNRFRPAVAHPIPVRPILIFVDNNVRDRFAAIQVYMLVFKVEADLAAIIGNNLAPLGQHEDWQLRIAVRLLGKDVAGYDRIVAGLCPTPVPVIDKLRHRHITPVMVVIADALEMLFFSASVQVHRNFALGHGG